MGVQTSLPSDERETLRELPSIVKVRDVVRHARHALSGSERMLRVPYDLFHPTGPVRYEGDLATYLQDGVLHNGQVAESQLRDAHPGERVLVLLPDDSGAENQNEWWLCEVEEADGELD